MALFPPLKHFQIQQLKSNFFNLFATFFALFKEIKFSCLLRNLTVATEEALSKAHYKDIKRQNRKQTATFLPSMLR